MFDPTAAPVAAAAPAAGAAPAAKAEEKKKQEEEEESDDDMGFSKFTTSISSGMLCAMNVHCDTERVQDINHLLYVCSRSVRLIFVFFTCTFSSVNKGFY